jgi:hypothetical protein
METAMTAGRTTRTRLLGLAAAVAMALTAAACVPPPTSTTEGAELTVSKSTGLDPAGEVITVTGTGFTTTGNLGTRPPLYNQPGGVYVVFGSFGESWRPSQGGSQRQVIDQFWALFGSSYDTITALGTGETVQMNTDGSFSVDILVSAEEGTYDTLAIATYAGSGAVNSGEEILVPLEFATPE